MIFKKFSSYGAPKRWTFLDPDTGKQYEEKDLKSLVDSILSYREQNQLAIIDNLKDVIINYMCSLPEHCGACETANLHRTTMGYLKGGVALIKNLFFGCLVKREEADERAEICLSCPLNVFPDRDKFVEWADELAERCTDGLKSKYHDSLGNCAACSCNLRAKVWYGGKIELSEEEKCAMLGANAKCWQVHPIVKKEVPIVRFNPHGDMSK